MILVLWCKVKYMDLIRLKSIQKTVINYGQDRQKNEEFMEAVTFLRPLKK